MTGMFSYFIGGRHKIEESFDHIFEIVCALRGVFKV